MKAPIEKKSVRTEIEKSVFIASSFPVHSEAEVKSSLEGVREQHPKCSHVVYAYSLGTGPDRTLGMSDDGEPRGTAGKPAMNVLLHSDLTDVLVTIVRYFGGKKLGKGGLVRAYTECAKQALTGLRVKTAGTETAMQVTVGYDMFEPVQHILNELGADITDRRFAQEVTLYVIMNKELVDPARKRLLEATKGAIKITDARPA